MIKIYTSSGEELPLVNNSIKISKENNAFSDNITVYHNKYPFLIKEGKVTESFLGSKHLLVSSRNKKHSVKVQFLNETFDAELTVLGYLTDSRKCNIRFGSELLTITETSIKDFFSSYYFGDQIEYSETTNILLDQSFITEIETYKNKSYPEVDFNFPAIYIEGINSDDENFNLPSDFLNMRNLINFEFQLNSIENVYENYYNIINSNSLAPMPYLMALIERPLQSIGWALEGDFKDDELNSKILLIPDTNNNTLLQLNEGITIDYNDFSDWVSIGNPPYKRYRLYLNRFILGKHTLKITMHNIPYTSLGGVYFRIYEIDSDNNSELIFEEENIVPYTFFNYEVNFDFEVTNNNINNYYRLVYGHPFSSDPEDVDIRIINEKFDVKNFVQFHPTIELSRYIPDWSYIQLLNNIKLLRNCSIDFNEERKRVIINYNSKYISNYDYVDISRFPVKISDDSNSENISFTVQYANKESEQIDDQKNFPVPFKILTHGPQTITSSISEIEEEGQTITIYDTGIYTSESFEGKTLSLEDENGSLYNLNWKVWFDFLENSSELDIIAALPIDLVSKIQEKKKVYFNCIQFAVTKIEYSVSTKKIIEVKLYLKNINIKNSELSAPIQTPSQTIVINDVTIYTLDPYNSFVLIYTISGFTSVNLTATCQKLTQPYTDGIVYDNEVLVKNNITNATTDSVQVPLPSDDYYGWYEISLSQDGVVSNKFYLELEEPVIITPKQITWELISSSGLKGSFKLEYNFLLLDNSATILGTKRDINGNQLDPFNADNTIFKNINNMSDYPSGSIIEVEFPATGYWYVYISFSSSQSNNRPDEDSVLGFLIN